METTRQVEYDLLRLTVCLRSLKDTLKDRTSMYSCTYYITQIFYQ